MRLAAIQAAPVLLDREASTKKACELIREAGAAGAQLAAFGETWLPGYPWFLKRKRTPLRDEAWRTFLDQAVVIGGRETEQLCAAAAEAKTDVVIGIVEREGEAIYPTLLFISSAGTIFGQQRHSVGMTQRPLNWGHSPGAHRLGAYPRPYGRVSAKGGSWNWGVGIWTLTVLRDTQVHLAPWPGTGYDQRNIELSARREAVRLGSFFVVIVPVAGKDAIANSLHGLNSPRFNGRSMIVSPTGEVVAKAPLGKETILVADIDLGEVAAAKRLVIQKYEMERTVYEPRGKRWLADAQRARQLPPIRRLDWPRMPHAFYTPPPTKVRARLRAARAIAGAIGTTAPHRPPRRSTTRPAGPSAGRP